MTEWCENKFQVSGDPDAVGRAVAAINGCDTLFGTIPPPSGVGQAGQPHDRKAMDRWKRQWMTAWGTPLDVPTAALNSAGDASWRMETAWSPPEGFYKTFAKLYGVTVTAYWFFGGNGEVFAGSGVWRPSGRSKTEDADLPFGEPAGDDDEDWWDPVTEAWYDQYFGE